MPQLGETVAEGKITKWFKSAGDAVKPGDNLFEIETDKVSMEVPSTTAGVLAEIRVGAGEVAPVGAVVAVIAGRGRRCEPASRCGASPPQARRRCRPTARPAALARRRSQRAGGPAGPIKLDPFFEVRTPERNYGPARLAGGTTVTPLARRLAAEAGIDLARVTASGPHGRIVARDIEAATAGGAARHVAAAAAARPDRRPGQGALPRHAVRGSAARRHAPHHRDARLVQAKQTIPHFYLTADVEIGRLLALREEANAAAPKDKDGNPAFKLSVNDLVIKAWAAALQRVPAANAVWAEDRILRFKHSDIGRRGRDRGRADHAGDPAGRDENAHGHLRRDEGPGRARARKAQAARIPGRLVGDLQSRHVRRARVRGHHQSAAGDHPGGRRRAPAGGRDARTAASPSRA